MGGGGATGGSSQTGGAGGALDLIPAPAQGCGNGVQEAGEECDAGRVSAACNAKCETVACPAGCSCATFADSVLALCPGERLWDTASEICNAAGYEFDVPRSPEENAFLRAWASRENIEWLWLGGRRDEEGRWKTSDDIVFWTGGIAGEPTPGVFENWSPSQPDDFQDLQHCIQQPPHGGWDDLECTRQGSHFCALRPQTKTHCGDAILDSNEPCDTRLHLGCDISCSYSSCGNGVVDEVLGEACDDGNTDALDACNECQTTGLVAHHALDEKQGLVAWDSASFKYPARISGTLAESEHGIEFGEGTPYVELRDDPALSGDITMMAVVRGNAPLDLGLQNIVEHWGSQGETWLRFNSGSLQAGSWWRTDENTVRQVLDDSWLNQTHHVAARYAREEWILFVDGEAVRSEPATRGALELDGAWSIGGRAGEERTFKGAIRDVRLYSRALSEAEILSIASDALAEQ